MPFSFFSFNTNCKILHPIAVPLVSKPIDDRKWLSNSFMEKARAQPRLWPLKSESGRWSRRKFIFKQKKKKKKEKEKTKQHHQNHLFYLSFSPPHFSLSSISSSSSPTQCLSFERITTSLITLVQFLNYHLKPASTHSSLTSLAASLQANTNQPSQTFNPAIIIVISHSNQSTSLQLNQAQPYLPEI